jgi:hypothetical protein
MITDSIAEIVVGNVQGRVLSATGIDDSNWLGVLCDLGVEIFLSQRCQVAFPLLPSFSSVKAWKDWWTWMV